jgi:hypothetical protein
MKSSSTQERSKLHLAQLRELPQTHADEEILASLNRTVNESQRRKKKFDSIPRTIEKLNGRELSKEFRQGLFSISQNRYSQQITHLFCDDKIESKASALQNSLCHRRYLNGRPGKF